MTVLSTLLACNAYYPVSPQIKANLKLGKKVGREMRMAFVWGVVVFYCFLGTKKCVLGVVNFYCNWMGNGSCKCPAWEKKDAIGDIRR